MKTIVVVGVGALGSHVVPLLRNLKDVTLKVIDDDRVEAKNVQSQFHGKPNVGKSKVQSMQNAMNFLFGLKVEGVPHRLVQTNVYELLGTASLVLDCLDNGASRQIIQTFVRHDFMGRSGIPCLHGAVDGDGIYGRVCWDEHFTIDHEDVVGAPTCENGEHLPFLSIVASFMAQSAKVFLTQNRKVGYEINRSGVIQT